MQNGSWLFRTDCILLNFPKPLSFNSARGKALRFRRLTNEAAFGRRYREHGKELTTIIVIEAKHGRPHIHLLQEKNPNLKPEDYKRLWKKALKRWCTEKSMDVGPIVSNEGAAIYVSKSITDDYFPIISMPKNITQDGQD